MQMKIVYNCLNLVQGWFFPAACLLCAQPIPSNRDFCYGCKRSLPHLGKACPRCAAASESISPCGRCQQQPPAYTQAIALFSYASPIDHLIQGLKYAGRLNNARVLGELMAAKLKSVRPQPDVIMPVPLHPTRLRERGYNQSLELARPIARRLMLPLDYRSVKRIRATPPQTGLSLRERARNVRNAFAVTQPLAGLHIALVDDVMTTGHTMNALAACLRKAGAARVDVWLAARA
jgi:ComF family protein